MKIKDAYAAAAAFRAALNAEVISADEIIARTAICQRCPKRVVTRGAASNTSYVLGMLANRHRVPREISGYSCGVCSCSLMLLIPALKKDLHVDSDVEKKERPQSCWIHES